MFLLPASGATIYSNFSAGDTFQLNSGFQIGNFGDDIIAWGQEFTPSASSFSLDQIDLAFDAAFSPAHNELTLTLNASDVNGLPGPVLESFDVLSAFGQNQIVSLISSAHPVLADGGNYWVVAAFTNSSSPSDTALWNFSNNSSVTFSTSAQSDSAINGGAWAFSNNNAQMAVFRVSGTEVPEPSPANEFSTGLLLFAFLFVKHSKAARKS